MKKVLIASFIVLFSFSIGNATEQNDESKQVNTESYEVNIDKLDFMDIYYILDKNIFEFFKADTSKYNTELKQKNFKNSIESKKLKDTIEKLKKEVLLHKFVQTLPYSKGQISNYSLKDGGFYYTIRKNYNMPFQEITDYCFSLNGFVNEKLPIKTIVEEKTNTPQFKFCHYDLFIKCNDRVASIIESNFSNLIIEMEFYVTEPTFKSYVNAQYNMRSSSYDWYRSKTPYVVMNKTKISIKNKDTNEIIHTIQY